MTSPDPAADELVYTRVFGAPRVLVFECMTEPHHLAHFWGPNGMSTPVEGITVELRPGGVFRTVMVNDADGTRYTMNATYVTVRPPELLVWHDPESGVTTSTTFTVVDESHTEVEIRQSNVPVAFRSPENRAGFATSLDRFAEYVASRPDERT